MWCRVVSCPKVELGPTPGNFPVNRGVSEWYHDYKGQWEYDKTIKDTPHNRWRFYSHVKNVVSKYEDAKFSLFPLINERSPLSINSKLFIFKIYIRLIITYPRPAWTANISKSSWSKLEALQQSTSLHQIAGSDWYVWYIKRDHNLFNSYLYINLMNKLKQKKYDNKNE